VNETRQISYYCEVTSRPDACILWTVESHPVLYWSLNEVFGFLCDLEDEWHIQDCGRHYIAGPPHPDSFCNFALI
jgi:hypothetical protein